MEHETTNSNASLRAVAVAAVPPGLREHLLAWAAENHVTTPDDPFWSLAAGLVNALAAARAAGDAAARVEVSVGSIQGEIFAGTQRASADLAAGVAKSIEGKTVEAGAALVQAIGAAASGGAVELKKAAAGLDKLGAEKGAAFVEQWKAQVATAVERQARTALRESIARSWVSAAFALLLAASAGGAVALGGAYLQHRLITVNDLRFYNPDPRRDAVLHYNGSGNITEARDCPRRDAACLNIP